MALPPPPQCEIDRAGWPIWRRWLYALWEQTRIATVTETPGAIGDEDFPSNGLMVRTGEGVYTTRQVSATGSGISVANGDGVAGHPTVSLSATLQGTTASYTVEAAGKLSGIAAGAQVNVQSDWDAASGDALILNKPTLGTAAAADAGDFATASQGALADSAVQPEDLGDAALLDVGTSAGTVAAGDHNHSGVYQPIDADLTALAAAGNSSVLAATTASFLTADETKLDGIEAGADVTDATNVAAAGAVMDGDFSADGIMVRTGAGAYASRTITGTANQINVTNGDGDAGNPTFSTPQDIHTGASPQFAGMRIESANPTELVLHNTSAGTNNKQVRLRTLTNGNFQIATFSDADAFGEEVIRIQRSGTGATLIYITAPVQFAGGVVGAINPAVSASGAGGLNVSDSYFQAAAAMASNTWESIGPTGGGADNTWAALDAIPNGISWIDLRVVTWSDDDSSFSVSARINGSSATGYATLVHASNQLSGQFRMSTFRVRVSDKKFDLRIVFDSLDLFGVDLFLIGYGYNP